MAKGNKNSVFTISEAVSFGFEKAKANLFFYIVLFLIIIAIYIAFSVFQEVLKSNFGSGLGFLMTLISWVLSAVITLGVVTISFKIIDNKKPQYKDLFFKNWKLLFVFIIANLLRQIVIVIGFIFLIIPGIILAIKLQYIEYLIVDKKMGFEAINKSWEMTKGVKLKLFGLGLVLGLINILGALALLLGLFITIPLSMLASAYVYRKLLKAS